MAKSLNAPLPFDHLAKAIEARRSVYGYISGLRLDRAAPGEAWSSPPYRPVFGGATEKGVSHGGVGTSTPRQDTRVAAPPPPVTSPVQRSSGITRALLTR